MLKVDEIIILKDAAFIKEAGDTKKQYGVTCKYDYMRPEAREISRWLLFYM
jgi:hypothetical protein